jgi:phosphatidylglycerol:prolipoprotein diacylglycerol transferase
MRPILFQWRGIEIYSYPAMLYLGLVFGITAGNYAAHVTRLDSARVFVATLLLLLPALAGARLLSVFSHWELYQRDLKRIWRRSEGGSALYGGLVALLLSVPLLAVLHVPFWTFWDVATFTILIAMILTRFGCLLNGCCAGRATQGWYTLSLPNRDGIWQRRLPTQLLEAGWAFLLLVGAVASWHLMPFRGALFLSAVVGYGMGRFVLELTRESQDRVGKLRLHHAISVTLIALALTTFIVVWRM